MSDDEALELLDKHCAQLSEHFDCVQILASRLMPDGETRAIVNGTGNWYARQGMAREFLQRAQAEQIGRSVAEHSDGEEIE